MSQKYKVYINNQLKVVGENWKFFKSKYLLVKAAGGIVYNANNELLMIYRNNKWDLPKGKIEKGETPKQCALREVEEETGVEKLKILDNVCEKTYHTYKENGKDILKKTYWYTMYTDWNGHLTPQRNEGVNIACWVNKTNQKEKIANSFNNIKDLFVNETI